MLGAIEAFGGRCMMGLACHFVGLFMMGIMMKVVSVSDAKVHGGKVEAIRCVLFAWKSRTT